MRVTAIFFGRAGAGAFNAAGVAGLARAAARHGITPTILWEDQPARREATVRQAAVGADLLIAHGGQGEAAVAALAADFPATRFAVTQGRITGPNIAGFEVLQEQSAFLAGALAGWWLDGQGKAAHLSGERVPPGLRGRAGFAHGLAHVSPDLPLLSGFCGDQHDSDLAARWTSAQAAAGARIQFTMLDGGRAGAIAAGAAAGLRGIGNVHDWTAENAYFLASALADSGAAVEAAVAAFIADTFADQRIGLENPACVRLALAPEVPASLRARLDSLAAAILAGEVIVPEGWGGAEFLPGPVS